jgi:hypothetical protein
VWEEEDASAVRKTSVKKKFAFDTALQIKDLPKTDFMIL